MEGKEEDTQQQRKGKQQSLTYNAEKIIGNGSFGVVFKAIIAETGETVAIKKVFQDKRYKNRELTILKMLHHPNCVEMRQSFYTNGDKPDEVYLNVVMDYIPDTAYRVMKQYLKMKQKVPNLIVKLYSYQLMRSIAYIHAKGICHRDIKPQNILCDMSTHILKLCDFGSAKQLVQGEPNVSYICSRYYRAPELIFGNSNYTTSIDVWSVGCVIAELMLGQPIFPGESGVDQLVEIIKILGTPSKEQIQAMNPDYKEYRFPQIRPLPWEKVFRHSTPREAINFVARLLQYDPKARPSPLSGLLDPYFDELRE
mmetsp:Transcript_2743/g.4695  ORF Transcript_2743/g.4695 Transcript_2743/m.4695 type:complete len:311 (+) Transcript_2743:26-958(+)|eukprot:CAMPEP_0168628104 /NCGR_PEP_ID=MMETSP0449_2-20121227/11659_1 /TAXON_ID=1082188 /ORGANISM="Strombidium rassoulzadegani, Strain ras09" /LENGTH=310 /DNA_ID=CAMNT_0008670487 /DNA_START=24 /DNA_END=956 /DNA_ORIENTATION=+